MARQIENATESAIDQGADLESNELRVGRPNLRPLRSPHPPGEDVRRTAARLDKHEVCPLR